ncbi:MAG: Crp/Fnr family transcriptional regulator [Bacillota bacterium]|nr:Crp/Fnr family transcriptional regulator [Bacillota bacterium]
MEKYLDVLRRCALFDGVGDEEIPAMLSCLKARVIKVEKGENIFTEGEPARYVGIILSGEAQIIMLDYFGHRSIMSFIEPAQIFGESFACADVDVLPVSVVASSPCEVLLIDCRYMVDVCSRACSFHNKMIYNMLKIVARKNLEFNRKIEITSKRSTREKLMAYLMTQAKLRGSNNFTIPFDRQELADYLGVERSAMSAELSRMRREGLVDYKRSWFKVQRNQNGEEMNNWYV